MVTTEQLDRAFTWYGKLVACTVILNRPWQRLWNLCSGRPVRIRPHFADAKVRAEMPRALRAKLTKRTYNFSDLVKFALADRLLTRGLPGPVVQSLVDNGRLLNMNSLQNAGAHRLRRAHRPCNRQYS